MGDPRRKRKQYQTPTQRWNKVRIEEEGILVREYGLKNKEELWKAQSILRKFTTQAKRLVGMSGKQRELEQKQLIEKLKSLGLLKTNITLESVLGLTLKDILERRLQTIVFRKGLALTANQARQFIIHQHICIGNQKINVPSHLVKIEEESKITYSAGSPLTKEAHAEMVKLKKTKKTEEKAEKE